MPLRILVFLSLLWAVGNAQKPRAAGDQLFPTVTCTSHQDCDGKIKRSQCVFYTDDANARQQRCACLNRPGERYERTSEDPDSAVCVLLVAVGGVCTGKADESRCADTHAQCVLDATLTGGLRCNCKAGFVTVWDDSKQTHFCAKALPSTAEGCATCAQNQGQCYDSDGDGAKDGCQCKLSRSGEDCVIAHLKVTCTILQKTICYQPQDGVDFSAGSQLFTNGHANTVDCRGRVLDATAATEGCPEGHVLLQLPLQQDRLTCGTRDVIGPIRVQRFVTLITVTPSAPTGHTLHFETFCAFHTATHAVFSGVGVDPRPGNEMGQTLLPQLQLSVLDPFGHVMEKPDVLEGDYIRFEIKLTEQDPVVYSGLKVMGSLLSSRPTTYLPVGSEVHTSRLVINGCPVPGQDTMDQFNAWQQVAPRTLRTGLVPMRALGSDGVVYLHNNVRLCTANNAEECEPSDCTVAQTNGGSNTEGTEGNTDTGDPAGNGADTTNGEDTDNTGGAGNAEAGAGTDTGNTGTDAGDAGTGTDAATDTGNGGTETDTGNGGTDTGTGNTGNTGADADNGGTGTGTGNTETDAGDAGTGTDAGTDGTDAGNAVDTGARRKRALRATSPAAQSWQGGVSWGGRTLTASAPRRQKRAAVMLEDGATDVPLSIGVNVKGSQPPDKGNTGSSSQAPLSQGQTAVVAVTLVCLLAVLAVLLLYVAWRRWRRRVQVVDYVPEKPQSFALPRMERNLRI